MAVNMKGKVYKSCGSDITTELKQLRRMVYNYCVCHNKDFEVEE